MVMERLRGRQVQWAVFIGVNCADARGETLYIGIYSEMPVNGTCWYCAGLIGADNPVGAGLLAKAVGQATLILNVLASSRASPLPQEFVVFSG
ncbi:hypothetical protein AM274_18580 [Pseudomonas nunensis]|nr:hypothetical protein AM274_18580 [Pseudomonas nunensis]